jgi:hypothetical protein
VYAGDNKIAEMIRVRRHGHRINGDNLAEVEFKGRDGERHTSIYEMGDLHSINATKLIKSLSTAGFQFPIEPERSKAICDALYQQRPSKALHFDVVPDPGWWDGRYLFPNQCICPKGSRPALIDPYRGPPGQFCVGRKSLKYWQKKVATRARRSNAIMIAITSVFAAPILREMNLDSYGVNFFGPSSTGKTTSLKIAAAACGYLDKRGGQLATWNATPAGVEDHLMACRDSITIFDEAGAISNNGGRAQRSSDVAFTLSANKPRAKSKIYEFLNNQIDRDFRTILLSTSEMSLAAIAESSGKNRLVGETVRFLDFPVVKIESNGVLDRPPKPRVGESQIEANQRFLERLERAALASQGRPRHAFINRLVHKNEWPSIAKLHMARFEDCAAKISNSRDARRRTIFSVLYAGAALAIDFGVLPWKKGEIRRALLAYFESLSDQNNAEQNTLSPNDVAQAALSKVRSKVSDFESGMCSNQNGILVTINKNDILVLNAEFHTWVTNAEYHSLERSGVIMPGKHSKTVEKRIFDGKKRRYVRLDRLKIDALLDKRSFTAA